MTPKPRKPPGNLSHLQRLANAAAADANVPVGRYQRWINTHVISAVLDRVRDEDGEPLFTLKGGAAMELRLGHTARASRGYDAAFRATKGTLDALDRALADDWAGFQLQRTEPELIRDTKAMRVDIQLAYKGRRWGTVQLEVAPAEGAAGQEIDRVPARSLDPVQIEGPERIACVAVRYQIAQKIHACTEIPTTAARTTASAISSTFRSCASSSKTVACQPFAPRASRSSNCAPTTPGPRTSPSGPRGRTDSMARDIDFYTDDVELAAGDVRAFIAEINDA